MRKIRCFSVFVMLASALAPGLLLADAYTQINLVSDVPFLANTTDPDLKNPWGVAFSATSPFWISNQATGTATLYNGAGAKAPLTVTIPAGATPPGGPTGQVFNGGSGLVLGDGSSAKFIFDTLNGTIDGWNSGLGATAAQEVSTPGAVYTGLAIASVSSSTYVYAADSTGQIRVFDSSWNNVSGTTFAGKFVDPNLPAGFVPFNIQLIGSDLYVTFASLTSTGAANPGGFVDAFDTSGNFIERVATGGALYAPWGVTLAPGGFGAFSNDLLIGNFGNGEILAFNPTTDAYLGTLDGVNGLPLVNGALWALETRTGGSDVNPDALYFTAGINNEKDGLFGEIVVATPEPATIFESVSVFLLVALFRKTTGRSRSRFSSGAEPRP